MPLPLMLNIVFLYLLFSGIAGFFGRNRRIGFWGFFFLSLVVTPLITSLLIYFAASPKAPRRRPAPRRG